jgi:7-cyano-7-deazaguanine tRNA-ribosyltransferase
VHVAVRSIWGPVPLELDHVWPLSQSVVPEALDLEALEAAEVFFREWAAGAGYPFGLLWEGEETLDDLLGGSVTYVVSKNTGKVRNVRVDGEHVLSLRAEDGWLTLKAAGARRLWNAFSAPRLRVVVDPDAVSFAREGKNVFAKFVRNADPEIRPGDEALVVSPDDELCAVAQATMNRREMLAFKRGVAARVREGVPHPPSAPPH